MKKKLITLLLILGCLLGLSILLYPAISNYYNERNASKAIVSYIENVESLSETEYEKMLGEAHEYNEKLYQMTKGFQAFPEMKSEYKKCLDIDGSGIMGYISIPSISVNLPVFHGTGEAVLQVAAGHIDWSSLPVGGENTHSVISGHRGLPTAKLFTHLDRLKVGDVFSFCILKENYFYEIDNIQKVLPEEVDSLMIEEGRDQCTLVTCTPYGVNTHRLLITGHRTDGTYDDQKKVRVVSEVSVIDTLVVAPVMSVPMLIILFIWLNISTALKKKHRQSEKAVERELHGETPGKNTPEQTDNPENAGTKTKPKKKKLKKL